MISSLYLSNPSTQASDSRYFQYDGLGNVIGRTNQQGNSVSSYAYEAFGAITSQSGQLGNAYTYMGQAYDSSTGLYYFNARWYDSSIGRFISADPLPGNPFQSGSTNRYAYALDNPIAFEDVSGLKSVRAAPTQDDPPPFNWEGLFWAVLGLLAAIAAILGFVAALLALPTMTAVLGGGVTLFGFLIAFFLMTGVELLTAILLLIAIVITVVIIVAIIAYIIYITYEWLQPRLVLH